MRYWLFDFELDKKLYEFWMNKWGGDIRIVETRRTGNRLHYWINGAWKVLKQSNHGDIIFCWLDIQAIICFVLCKITFRKRYIIAQNIMLKMNKSVKGRLYAMFYKWALSADDFYGTVQSAEYGRFINESLNINKNYELVHDPFLEKYYIQCPKTRQIRNSVFMGGTSSRDWRFAFEIARQMPKITFNFVMTKKMYTKYQACFLNNTNVLCDIPKEEYNRLLCDSTIVIMPTSTEAPAGLMLIFVAAANNKLCITNNTATLCEYINNERGCSIPKKVDLWVNMIDYYLHHAKDAEVRANNLRKFVETECSAEKYVLAMKRICNKIECLSSEHSFNTVLKGKK